MPDSIEDIAALKAILDDADSDAFWNATAPLTKADFLLMGKVIQLYCYADLNARRIIDSIRCAALGPNAMNGSRLKDEQVLEKLREAAGMLWESGLKDGLLKAADTIGMHRIHRHTFAHWSARRIAGYNALILFTNNAREAQRRDGADLAPQQLKYALMPLTALDEEVSKLEGHAKYLAVAASHIHSSLDNFRERFAHMKSERTGNRAGYSL